MARKNPNLSRKSFVSTLANGLSVIRAFANSSPAMTLSDVARKTGLTRATARRILLTLQQLGYVDLEEKAFRLQPSVLDLGYSYLSSLGWLGLAQQELSNLALQVRLPCNAAVLQGNDVIYVLRIVPEMDTRISMSISVGQRFPAYVTALGRVLVGGLSTAALDEYFAHDKFEKLTPNTTIDRKKLRAQIVKDRMQGWSFVNQEHASGLCSIAAPVISASGVTFAALGVGWLVGTESPQEIRDKIRPKLVNTARRLNRALGHFGHDA
jgi:IclR family transcriptional regulator, pca regulon regulatory protein